MKDSINFNLANGLAFLLKEGLLTDFINFNNAVDDVKNKYGCSEEDAIEIVSKLWNFDIDKIKEKEKKKSTIWKYTIQIDGIKLTLCSKEPNLNDRIEDIRKQLREVAFKTFGSFIKEEYFSGISAVDSFDDYIEECTLIYEDFIREWSPVYADDFEECEDIDF